DASHLQFNRRTFARSPLRLGARIICKKISAEPRRAHPKALAAQIKDSAGNLWNGKSMTFETESLSPGAGGETWDHTGQTFGKSRWLLGAIYLRAPIIRFFIGFLIVAATFAIAWPFLPRRYEATATIILHPTRPESATDSAESLRQTL